MALIAADFADQENSVEGDAGDEKRKEGDADGHGHDAPPVEDDPADVKDNGNADEAHPEQGEQNHVAASTGKAHGTKDKVPATIWDREHFHFLRFRAPGARF